MPNRREKVKKVDGKSEEIKIKEKDLNRYNKEISKMVKRLDDLFDELKIANRTVDAAMLKSAYEGITPPVERPKENADGQ